MMNGLALFLVFSSLVGGSLWSATPDRKPKAYPGAEEVIVKQGTRVVVVEYDIQGPGNTKVSISTPEAGLPQKPTTGEHKPKEAFDVLPNLGQGLSSGEPPAHLKELICDAFGKCKETASKIGRVEHRVSEKAHEIREGAKEMYSKVKEKVTQKAHDVEEEVEDAYAQGKEKTAENIHEVQEGVKDAVKKAKYAAGPTYDLSKTIAEDVVGNISKIVSTSTDQMKQRVRGERQGEAKEGVEIAKSALDGFINQGEHDLSKRVDDAMNYTLPSASFIRSLMCMIHILGFATAYGVCVWVTFFSSFVLAGALPNQQFGIVQSKIYPFYFKAMAFCVGLALLGHILSQREKVFLGKAELFQAQTLSAALIIVLINQLFVEPRATKVHSLLLKPSFAYCLRCINMLGKT